VSRSITLKFTEIAEQRLILMACWVRGMKSEVEADDEIRAEILQMCREEIERRQPKDKPGA